MCLQRSMHAPARQQACAAGQSWGGTLRSSGCASGRQGYPRPGGGCITGLAFLWPGSAPCQISEIQCRQRDLLLLCGTSYCYATLQGRDNAVSGMLIPFIQVGGPGHILGKNLGKNRIEPGSGPLGCARMHGHVWARKFHAPGWVRLHTLQTTPCTLHCAPAVTGRPWPIESTPPPVPAKRVHRPSTLPSCLPLRRC